MIIEQLKNVKQHIQQATQAANRPAGSVTLVAVSKRHGSDKIRAAYEQGQRDFGENYLHEALAKQAALASLDIIWHFIGHIQSNKTRKIAEYFAWVHTVDSLKIARRLSSQRPADLPPLNICLQINIDNEDSKSGLFPDKDNILNLAKQISILPHLQLRGLMCIPAPKTEKTAEQATFQRMQDLLAHLNHHGIPADTLSMGMSDDLASAIAHGATIVRVGTAIFGQRPPP